MQTFDYYGMAWLIYSGLGLCLLLLIAYKMKKASWNFKFGLLSLIAVGAFTPAMVLNAKTYAPLILTSLLNAEVQGVNAIFTGLIKLAVIWGIIFFTVLAIRHFLKVRQQKNINSSERSTLEQANIQEPQ